MSRSDTDGTSRDWSRPGEHPSDIVTVAQPGRGALRGPQLGDEVGPYHLLDRIARGGLGDVYRARHRDTGAVVALKVVRAGGGDDSAERRCYDREIEAARRLDHPHLLPILDAGEHDGLPYFAMPFVPGGNLGARLRAGPMAPGPAARLVAAIARAVHFAHQSGVLHRDLKPANILIGDGDEPLVADFGLARFLDQSTSYTLPGALMGSVPYMAPEQAAGQGHLASPATDVWALGVILYESLTGRRPFRAPTAAEVLRLIERADPPWPCAVSPDLPADLDAICRRCLAKAPADRYPCASRLADDLEAWLAGRPIADLAPIRPARPGRRLTARSASTTSLLCAGALALVAAWALTAPHEAAPPRPADRHRALLRRAAPGRPAVLLNLGRRPLWHSIEHGEALFRAVFRPGEPALINTPWYGLYELLPPDPTRGDYRLIVEMSHLDGDPLSYVGGYVGRRAHAAPGAPGHSAILAALRDPAHEGAGPGPAQAALGLLSLGQPPGRPVRHHRTLFPPHLPLKGPPQTFELEVRADLVRLTGQGRAAVIRRPLVDAVWRTHRRALMDRDELPPEPYTAGGAGLVLCRGLAAVRRVVYEPLPPSP